ncbi:tRNA1(Val) (adenine(37)-N6)-methyltransferase [Microaerobacter geothermalis]|uniref:tRNA1(Val) (adenine(37)-N6)-methyltransferase n=1 Tax=Microaerobacter geothermalis TaxID=674972 RepID=UPI001F2C914B|nr:tRNA1(Val) (adenine(37)-N6)-methyltransferase [Microaerobacter geothermalis]MCF6095147.1 tRNA1(Val) (adenine(37)-N6)-methyltransferase [Microaerobacter geothermalis]
MADQLTLYEDERIDDLLTNDLKIIQSKNVFCFSMDAVLLSHFVSVPVKGKIVDLCSGNGVIPLLLSTRTKAQITGVELQPRIVDMALRSIAMNHLDQQIHMIHGDIKEAHLFLEQGGYDVVTCNPPYLSKGTGDQNVNSHLAIARHEIYCNLEEVIIACSKLVKSGGKVALVHRPSRMVDLLYFMRKYRIEPKRIRFVHPRIDEAANMILVEGIKDGGVEVRLLPPMVVYEENGEYTSELMKIYYGG